MSGNYDQNLDEVLGEEEFSESKSFGSFEADSNDDLAGIDDFTLEEEEENLGLSDEETEGDEEKEEDDQYEEEDEEE